MTIAVGGNIGATLNQRDALLETQTIMTADLKYPVAVSVWDDQKALRYDPSGTDNSGLLGNPVKIKTIYPLNNNGNGFVYDPRYVVADLNNNILTNFNIDLQTGNITLTAAGGPYLVGKIQFRVREGGIQAEHVSQINNLNSVIDDLTNVVAMFQKQENALLNSGAIS